jgi:hypothetical protein
MTTTLPKQKQRVPTFLPAATERIFCKGSIKSSEVSWPNDAIRSQVATYLLNYRFKDLLEIERATCERLIEGYELSASDTERMDRLVNQYGYEL